LFSFFYGYTLFKKSLFHFARNPGADRVFVPVAALQFTTDYPGYKVASGNETELTVKYPVQAAIPGSAAFMA
jgi:hypothetical protein